jgi:TRAP-type C4-dicarboxylate transport system permease small subunit
MKFFFRWTFKAIEAVVILVSVVMSLVVFFQVVLRHILDQPFGWTEELGRVTLLIFVMLGGILAYRDGRHLGLDIVENRLSPRPRLYFQAFKRLLIILFAAVMIQQGITLINSLYARTPILSIPFSTLYLIFPFTMALILLMAFIQFTADLRKIMRPPQAGGQSPSGKIPAVPEPSGSSLRFD